MSLGIRPISWPAALLAAVVWVVLAVLPLGAVMTGLCLWRRNLLFLIITHVLMDLPILLIAFGVLPPI